MKKTLHNLFTGILIASTTIVAAQPTLTGTGCNPVVGDNFTLSTSGYFSQGTSGANQTWNNSTLTPTASSGETCVTVASTTNGSSFPIANTAVQGGTTVSYYNASSTASQNYGYDAGGTLIIYSNPEDLLHFPFSYNNTYTDGWAATFVSGGYTYYRKGTTTITADAYGTLTTPNGTYTNAMRIHMVQAYTDSVYVGAPTVITYNNDEYMWYKNGVHSALAYTYSMVANGSTSTNGGYLSSALSVNEIDNSISMFNVYPSPANSFINVQFNLTESKKASFKVYNTLGAEMSTTAVEDAFAGINNYKIDVANLPEGIYFVQIVLENGNVETRRFTVAK